MHVTCLSHSTQSHHLLTYLQHTPPGDEAFRLTHKTLKDADVDATNILPAVTIRDPYVWMNRYVVLCHVIRQYTVLLRVSCFIHHVASVCL